MKTGNSVADQGEKDYERRGICPHCKRELILADEINPCELAAKFAYNPDSCEQVGTGEGCSVCKCLNPVFQCDCGYEFQKK